MQEVLEPLDRRALAHIKGGDPGIGIRQGFLELRFGHHSLPACAAATAPGIEPEGRAPTSDCA